MTVAKVSQPNIQRAAEIISGGGIAAFPTETVYGLGADATNADAVLSVYEMKGRPRFNPLIAHIADLESAEQHGVFSDSARGLAKSFWPGPLTIVVPRKPESSICDIVTAGLDTVALRVPSNDVARTLLIAAKCPVAAPSANRAGHVSPTTAQHVFDDLGDEPDIILDGGDTTLGLESTVIDMSGSVPSLLRPGGVSREELEEFLNFKLKEPNVNDQPISPGQLASHYAPNAKMRLEATSVEPGEALLSFGPMTLETDGPTINLSREGDLREAAARLFSALRQLDSSNCETIAVMPIPGEGLGEAINDRLRKAAAPRPNMQPQQPRQ